MSGPKTDSTGQIVPQNGKGDGQGLHLLLRTLGPEMARALPRHLTPERMARVCLTALRTTPKLIECTPQSFAACLMTLAQLGLEPNTPLGQAYLIPRNSRKKNCVECTTIIGYQGYLDLARRSGLVTSTYAHVVRDGDSFRFTLGLEPTIEHVPSAAADREERRITHVYGVARLRDGDPVFVVLSIAQVEARRRRSSSREDGPWVTDYEAMVLKTAIRALWRWMPKSAEMVRADDVERVAETHAAPTALLEEQQVKALASAGVFVAPEDDAAAAEPGAGDDPGEVA